MSMFAALDRLADRTKRFTERYKYVVAKSRRRRQQIKQLNRAISRQREEIKLLRRREGVLCRMLRERGVSTMKIAMAIWASSEREEREERETFSKRVEEDSWFEDIVKHSSVHTIPKPFCISGPPTPVTMVAGLPIPLSLDCTCNMGDFHCNAKEHIR